MIGEMPGADHPISGKARQTARVVQYLMGRYQVSERRATRAARFCLSSIRYQSCRDPLTALRQRMRELAQTRVRFGYRRLLVLLRREGWELGKKRCYRVYTEEGLTLRRKRPWRHATAVHREQRRPATARNDIWRMDFVADQLADGPRFVRFGRAVRYLAVDLQEFVQVNLVEPEKHVGGFDTSGTAV
jgi:putative transposase